MPMRREAPQAAEVAKKPAWDRTTRAVHAGREANETTAISVPIYQSSTFRLDSAAHWSGSAQLHFHEDERPVAHGDEVDLTLAAAHVAFDHLVAAPLKIFRRELLAEPAQARPIVPCSPAHLAASRSAPRTAARTGANESRCTVEYPRLRNASMCSAEA